MKLKIKLGCLPISAKFLCLQPDNADNLKEDEMVQIFAHSLIYVPAVLHNCLHQHCASGPLRKNMSNNHAKAKNLCPALRHFSPYNSSVAAI